LADIIDLRKDYSDAKSIVYFEGDDTKPELHIFEDAESGDVFFGKASRDARTFYIKAEDAILLYNKDDKRIDELKEMIEDIFPEEED
jgi:hypothetical protein